MRNFLVLFLTLFVLAQGTCYANKEGSKSMSKIVQTAGRDNLGSFAPEFAHFNDDILFGENDTKYNKLK